MPKWAIQLIAAGIVLGVFVIIYGIAVGRGGSIEIPSIFKVTVEKQVANFDKLTVAFTTSPTPQIDELAAKFNAGVDVWWKLLQYRIDLRADVRDICGAVGGHLRGTDPSFTEVLECARQRNALTENTANELDRIRCYTYYAEWRAGPPPDKDAVMFVLRNGPSLAKELGKTKESLRASPKTLEPSVQWKAMDCG